MHACALQEERCNTVCELAYVQNQTHVQPCAFPRCAGLGWFDVSVTEAQLHMPEIGLKSGALIRA